jgi:hypothetical protein
VWLSIRLVTPLFQHPFPFSAPIPHHSRGTIITLSPCPSFTGSHHHSPPCPSFTRNRDHSPIMFDPRQLHTPINSMYTCRVPQEPGGPSTGRMPGLWETFSGKPNPQQKCAENPKAAESGRIDGVIHSREFTFTFTFTFTSYHVASDFLTAQPWLNLD